MTVSVDVQTSEDAGPTPDAGQIRSWVAAALSGRKQRANVSLRLTGRGEMTELNQRYRDREGPTNVLSFPADLPPGVRSTLLGDIVICGPVVVAEAKAQGKPVTAHWAHLVVHGTLHLIGFDHIDVDQARRMESLERQVLAELGYSDPYRAA